MIFGRLVADLTKSPHFPSQRGVVRNGTKNDAKKRFPDWSSSDEASPAKAPRRETTPAKRPSDSKTGDVKSSSNNSSNNIIKKPGPLSKKLSESSSPAAAARPSPPTPARRKLTEIQFQERRQLLLCSYPDAAEKSLRRAIESTETAEEADDWFFKFGERKTVDMTDVPGRNMPRVYKDA